MKIAIIGLRNLTINDLEKYIPDDVCEIVSGGAKGVDTCAENFAKANGIKLTVFLPDYKKFGKKVGPIKRNIEIIEYCDSVIAFWDGTSKGTKFVIDRCKKLNKSIVVYRFQSP